MRYFAHVDYDSISLAAGQDHAAACVSPTRWTGNEPLALRHARAMAAVLRAAKAECAAEQRACGDHEGKPARLGRWYAAQGNTRRAVERLLAVEKEVQRGK